MSENRILPEKITKPIQLLAAWLTGLVLLVSALLTAAGTINKPEWLPALFGISAIIIIPLFLFMIFLLQTRFRPEMQEDSYYAQYLNRNTMTFEPAENNINNELELSKLKEEILEISAETKKNLESISSILKKRDVSDRSKEIDQILNESDKKIEELKKLAKYSSIDLKINKTLPLYYKIIETIMKFGFQKYTEFGNKSIEKMVIAFGKNIPTNIVRDFVTEFIPLGLSHIKLAMPSPKGGSVDSTIYIGSYNINSNKILLNDDLKKKLQNAPENQTFGEFIKQY